ncbi:MAG: glycosyltransferase [Ignavibacteriae bacterium]|nr:MAG: glycosyltransferase [Ignavibacteriota bacterium]
MKINFIVPEIVRSGGIRVIFDFANRLTNKGHEVTLYTPVIPFNPFKPSIKFNVFKHQVNFLIKQFWGKPYMPKHIFPYCFKIKAVSAINNFFVDNADAIIATSWVSSHYVNKLAKSKGKKFYLIQDYEIWNSNVKLVDKSYTLPLNRIVIAKHLQYFFKEKFGVDSKVIRYGVNFDFFENKNKTYNNKNKTLLFLDHLLENKNAIAAIDTVKMVKQKYPDIIVKGFGIQRFHEIPGFVEFYENPDDVKIKELYCNSDIYIYPTLFEGCPTTPVEAMACKCAVVANASAEIPYYIKNKETGILANPLKKNELFDGVCYLLENEKELQKISEAGSRSVREIFNWDKSVNELEVLLKS